MSVIRKIYNIIVDFMALISAILLIWTFLSVLISVLLRNLNIQPSPWIFLSSEYSIFYLTMLGSPWLVRNKGHVYIELLTSALPEIKRIYCSRFVAIICFLTCITLAWYSVELLLSNIERNDYDVRAFFVPKWMLTLVFPISFFVMAIEFLFFIFGKEIMHTGEAGVHE